MEKVIIGTRGSKLALVQAKQIQKELNETHKNFSFEIKVIHTTGDKILDAPLSKIGEQGLFTKELENSLLAKEIDLAVHSLKDVPTRLPEGLILSAINKRITPFDVYISKNGTKIEDLKDGDTVATSSMRRKSQLLAYNNKLNIVDIRGNVQTRLKRMEESKEMDGMILAHAGLSRLGMENIITQIIPETIMLPAVGQASIGIETREDDEFINKLVETINDKQSQIEIECERAFLKTLEGGCQVPIGGYAKIMRKYIFQEWLLLLMERLSTKRTQ